MSPDIRVRRVYDAAEPRDGTRVLVDRVWPRGLRKDAARLDDWAKDVAPSTDLRKWYGHDPAKFGEGRRRTRPPPRPGEARAGDAADRDPRRGHQPGRRPGRAAARGAGRQP